MYDHPTALDGDSTLPALMESLERLDVTAFYLMLIVAVTGPDVAVEAHDRVRSIANRYPSVRTLVFGTQEFDWLAQRLRERSDVEAESFVALRSYPLIRNLQLVLPLALKSGAIVALDDDEIVTDEAFVTKAVEPLGSTVNGHRVDGVSGHYLQEDGGILLKADPEKAASRNLFDRKASIMNEATERVERVQGNLVETPFCFGGNMEFTPDLAASVGFDPCITRGEDIDYLINARMEGKHFFLRKDLRILHRPPKGGSYRDVSTSKLEQDVIRFMYERAKLQASHVEPDLHPVSVSELEPYPGEFLGADIESDGAAALAAAGYPGDVNAFLQSVREDLPRRVNAYLRFRREWPEFVTAVTADEHIAEYLDARVSTGA